MTYAIITGAHLFPYAWFYDEKAYAIAAFIIPVGALIMALMLAPGLFYYIPFFTSGVFLLVFLWIFINVIRTQKP